MSLKYINPQVKERYKIIIFSREKEGYDILLRNLCLLCIFHYRKDFTLIILINYNTKISKLEIASICARLLSDYDIFVLSLVQQRKEDPHFMQQICCWICCSLQEEQVCEEFSGSRASRGSAGSAAVIVLVAAFIPGQGEMVSGVGTGVKLIVSIDALKHNSSPFVSQMETFLIYIFLPVREFMHNIQQISILISFVLQMKHVPLDAKLSLFSLLVALLNTLMYLFILPR